MVIKSRYNPGDIIRIDGGISACVGCDGTLTATREEETGRYDCDVDEDACGWAVRKDPRVHNQGEYELVSVGALGSDTPDEPVIPPGGCFDAIQQHPGVDEWDGDCVAVARTLQAQFGGRLKVYRQAWTVHHAFVELPDDRLYDGRGRIDKERIVEEFGPSDRDGVPAVVDDVAFGWLPEPDEAVHETMTQLVEPYAPDEPTTGRSMTQ